MIISSHHPNLMDTLILVSLLLVSASILFFRANYRSNRKPPPGPWKLPLIGNLHNLMGGLPHRTLHQLAQKYGEIMELQLGEVRLVVVSSADAAQDVVKTHDINFATRPPIPQAEIIGYGGTNITYSPYGEYWRQLRKICTLELLSVKRVQSFGSLRGKVYMDVLKWVASMEGSPLNLSERLYSSTYTFTTTVALGKTLAKERGQLLPLIFESFESVAIFDIGQYYPSVRLFQVTSRLRRKLSEVQQKTDRVLEGIVNQRRQEISTALKREDEEDDLLDVLLKYTSDATDIRLTNDNIKAVVLDMLGAGTETSATTMDWAMAEMLRNPRVMKKAQDEVRRLFDEQGMGFVDEKRIHELQYLKLVVKETLRMHPPLPLLLPRKCGETCEVQGYEIPAGTKVYVNAWAINRDPKYWENPHSFQPERFTDSPVDFKTHLEYMPFGAGRRSCPGMTFGLANVELPLAMFLYHFDWKMSDGLKPEQMDMTEAPGIAIRRKNELSVVALVKRHLPHK